MSYPARAFDPGETSSITPRLSVLGPTLSGLSSANCRGTLQNRQRSGDEHARDPRVDRWVDLAYYSCGTRSDFFNNGYGQDCTIVNSFWCES